MSDLRRVGQLFETLNPMYALLEYLYISLNNLYFFISLFFVELWLIKLKKKYHLFNTAFEEPQTLYHEAMLPMQTTRTKILYTQTSVLIERSVAQRISVMQWCLSSNAVSSSFSVFEHKAKSLLCASQNLIYLFVCLFVCLVCVCVCVKHLCACI